MLKFIFKLSVELNFFFNGIISVVQFLPFCLINGMYSQWLECPSGSVVKNHLPMQEDSGDMLFHAVHGVLKAEVVCHPLPQWTAFCQNSPS